MVINEVDANQPGADQAEFVELYDGGIGLTSLDGLVLVFFNGGNDSAYLALDLDGRSTDPNGYFIVGNEGLTPDLVIPEATIQNGPDAVALYRGNAEDFQTDLSIRTSELLDAVVYVNATADDAGLLALLLPGEVSVDEDGGGSASDHSMQRCANGEDPLRSSLPFAMSQPTIRAANFCAATLPIAQFAYEPLQVFPGDPVTFDNRSLGTSTTWAWTFQDANVPTSNIGVPPSVIFQSSGLKTVTLTASNGVQSNTQTQVIPVLDPAPTVFSVKLSDATPEYCDVLTASVRGVSGRQPLTFDWRLRRVEDNDVLAEELNIGPEVQFSLTGVVPPDVYRLEVTANNDDGTYAAGSPSFVVPDTRPTVTLIPSVTSPTNALAFDVEISVGTEETVSGISAENLVVTGGTVNFFSFGLNTGTVTIVPDGNGEVTVQLPAGSGSIGCDVPTLASNLVTIDVDRVRPAPNADSTEPNPTSANPFQVSINFLEAVTGLTLDDIQVTNGTVGDLAGGPQVYTVNVYPAASGQVFLTLLLDSVTDAAGNTNQQSIFFNRTYEGPEEGEGEPDPALAECPEDSIGGQRPSLATDPFANYYFSDVLSDNLNYEPFTTSGGNIGAVRWWGGAITPGF